MLLGTISVDSSKGVELKTDGEEGRMRDRERATMHEGGRGSMCGRV